MYVHKYKKAKPAFVLKRRRAPRPFLSSPQPAPVASHYTSQKDKMGTGEHPTVTPLHTAASNAQHELYSRSLHGASPWAPDRQTLMQVLT